MSIRLDNRVALITGAGNGLGRTHALEFARRGAKVVVNDFGGNPDGSGSSASPAQKVVDEIIAAGGEAIADHHSVSDPEGAKAMVKAAIDKWGRLDILVNNAGILRDKSFAKVTLEDFKAVVDVHLMGSVYVTHAAWPHMVEQKYGRIIMTTSSSGLYGNFGQSNYAAAKLGMVGLQNVLKLEGQKNNIHVNTIAPIAATRLTLELLPPPVHARMKPEAVTAVVVYFASEDAPTGHIVETGAGFFGKVEIVEAEGAHLGADCTAEDVVAAYDKICDMSGAKPAFQSNEMAAKIFSGG